MDLSNIAPRATSEWYEIHLHNHAGMERWQRQAHLRSMKVSMGGRGPGNYNKKMRLVLDQDDIPGREQPWNMTTFSLVPDLELAVQLCDEVVIRTGVVEEVVKSPDAQSIGRTRACVTHLPEVATAVTGRILASPTNRFVNNEFRRYLLGEGPGLADVDFTELEARVIAQQSTHALLRNATSTRAAHVVERPPMSDTEQAAYDEMLRTVLDPPATLPTAAPENSPTPDSDPPAPQPKRRAMRL